MNHWWRQAPVEMETSFADAASMDSVELDQLVFEKLSSVLWTLCPRWQSSHSQWYNESNRLARGIRAWLKFLSNICCLRTRTANTVYNRYWALWRHFPQVSARSSHNNPIQARFPRETIHIFDILVSYKNIELETYFVICSRALRFC